MMRKSSEPVTPKFGQRYIVNALAVKKSSDYSNSDRKPHKYWQRIDWWCQPFEALCIGVRNVYDGNIEYDPSAEQNVFKPVKTHRVYLFVRNMKENPVYVFPEDVRCIDDEQEGAGS